MSSRIKVLKLVKVGKKQYPVVRLGNESTEWYVFDFKRSQALDQLPTVTLREHPDKSEPAHKNFSITPHDVAQLLELYMSGEGEPNVVLSAADILRADADADDARDLLHRFETS